MPRLRARPMIEAQARKLEAMPDPPLVAIGADAGLARFRRLMADRLQAEAQRSLG